MQSNIFAFAAKWKKLRHEIHHQWTQLSPDDIDGVRGRRDNLVNLLEYKCGFARRRAEREVERVLTEFEDMLRRAS